MEETADRTRILIVSATTLVPNTGVFTRVATTVRALAVERRPQIEILALESIRTFRRRDRLRERAHSFRELGARARYRVLLPQRIPGGRKLMVSIAARTIRRRLRQFEPDIVIAINSDAGAAASKAMDGSSAPALAVLELHGIESEEAIFSGKVGRGSLAHRTRSDLEQRALDWADIGVTPSPQASEWAAKQSTKTCEWIDLPTLSPLELDVAQAGASRSQTRSQLEWEQNLVLFYLGGMNPWQHPERMVEIFGHLIDLDARWRFLVITPDELAAQQHLASAGIDPEKYHVASVPHADVAKWAPGGDIALMVREAHLMNEVASPTKFGEYLECGVPVVTTTAVPEPARICRTDRVGLVIEEGDSNRDIAAEIHRFMQEERRSELYERCRAASRTYFGFERAVTVYKRVYERAPTRRVMRRTRRRT